MEDPTAAIEAARARTDPSERAKALSRIIDQVPGLHAWLRELRRQAYVEMHESGMSWQEIGDDQGVHRTRAAQIARGVTGGSKRRPDPVSGPPEGGP